MSTIDFGLSRRNELLLGIVAGAQHHRAKDIDSEVKPDAFCLDVITVSGRDGSNALFFSSLGQGTISLI